jgi:hypothetical protein
MLKAIQLLTETYTNTWMIAHVLNAMYEWFLLEL